MHRIVTAAAMLAATLAAPSFADDQRALSLGVEPGVYSATELSLLSRAREANDDQLERRILEGRETAERRDTVFGADVRAARGVTPTRNQLAASLGVDGAGHSMAELARMHFDASED